MGCRCTKHDKFDKAADDTSYNYIALALLNANRAASLMVHDMCPGQLERTVAEQIIRRAKNDGKTVSIVNGCLYLDYKFAGFMPLPDTCMPTCS
ncbi:hypothetical protein Ddc_05749 [Ditylenchus destructor]|nr:hypothetical protein Ddc_05749 [Ditylenchus destructor]